MAQRKKGIPIFRAEQAGSQWKVWCPYCSKYHVHGAGEGHVCAHCPDGPLRATGYYLLPPKERDNERPETR